MAELPRDDAGRPPADGIDGVLDYGLAFGFGARAGTDVERRDTVLAALRRRSGLAPEVQLRDLEEAAAPAVDPDSPEARASALGTAARYRILGEIARGGVGVVLKGRDTDLGRDLALKVLLEHHVGDPVALERFVQEAQIAGQLQHPGIVPVYDLGLEVDGRPYFTMKLVQGETLKALLAARKNPAADRRRMLGIFEKVLETIAYAHARGVIHRDLKPSNVMVGPFGEVQVMDWGLAKVLGRKEEAGGGAPREQAPAEAPAAEPAPDGAAVATVRSGRDDSRSQLGAVMGTPAFMSPEQARGEVAKLDERSDVFALGAILCEILTGVPPYLGESPEAIRERAAAADLGPALARLRARGVDPELAALARTCLAPDPADRPPHAGAVADALARYMAAADERARAAEVTAAEARVKAAEERKARRTVILLAGALVGAIAVAAAVLVWHEHGASARRLAATREASEAIQEATVLRTRAEAAGATDLTPWVRALEAARRAASLAARDEVAGEVQAEGRAVLRAVEAGEATARRTADQAAADQQLEAALERARVLSAESWDAAAEFEAGADAAYAAAFHARGLDFDATPPAQIAGALRESGVRRAVEGALIDWIEVRRRIAGRTPEGAAPAAGWEEIGAVLAAMDPDPLLLRMRDAHRRGDHAALVAIAASPETLALPAAGLEYLGSALAQGGDLAGAVDFLGRAQRARPDDFWIHFNLGLYSERARPPQLEVAARSYQAAAAIRPGSAAAWSGLGGVLLRQGAAADGERAFRRAIEANPQHAVAHFGLGDALRQRGELKLAAEAYQAGLALRPTSTFGRLGHAHVLCDLGQANKAAAEICAAIEQHAEVSRLHYVLGIVLDRLGRKDDAIDAYREAIRLNPAFAEAHNNLGNKLRAQGKYDEALAEYEAAAAAAPALWNPHLNLGHEWRRRMQLEKAVEAYKRVIELKPDCAEAHRDLGGIYFHRGENVPALASARAAALLEPQNAANLDLLAKTLDRLGERDEALACVRRAIELDPSSARVRFTLGVTLRRNGDLDGALEAFQSAASCDPAYAPAHYGAGGILLEQQRLDDAMAAFRRAVEIKPDYPDAWVNIATVHERKGEYTEAVEAYRKVIAAAPAHGVAHYNLGLVLSRLGRMREAADAYRLAVKHAPDDPDGYFSLADTLCRLRDLEEAKAAIREGLRRAPQNAQAYCVLGNICTGLGETEAALAAYREALRLQPDDPGVYFLLAPALIKKGACREVLDLLRSGRDLAVKQGRYVDSINEFLRLAERRVELEARLPAILRGGVDSVPPADRVHLAHIFLVRHRFDLSVRCWASAFAADPELAKQEENLCFAASAAAHGSASPAAFGGTDDEAERVSWRAHGLKWLRAVLSLLDAASRSTDSPRLFHVLQYATFVKHGPYLEPVRSEEHIAALPANEQADLRAFWKDLDRVEAEARRRIDSLP